MAAEMQNAWQHESGQRRLSSVSENQDQYITHSLFSQARRPGDHCHLYRRLVKAIIVNLACWELMPQSLADILVRGVAHD